jgi:hypothetical protein
MKKVDKSQEETILKRLLGGFFDSGAKGRARVVMDIIEDPKGTTMFVGISDANTSNGN